MLLFICLFAVGKMKNNHFNGPLIGINFITLIHLWCQLPGTLRAPIHSIPNSSTRGVSYKYSFQQNLLF